MHPEATVRLSEVLSALSYALDMVEGQPPGHVLRSCLIGMRLGEQMGLTDEQRSWLFYALLLKDAGCSSNAARISQLFGADDFTVKQNIKTVDWSRTVRMGLFSLRHVGGSPAERLRKLFNLGVNGKEAARQTYQVRCERGAGIALLLGFPEETAAAIRNLDEHWDGAGQPDGYRADQIPLLARISGLAQTIEVFYTTYGPAATEAMLEQRRGTWFDPRLVDLALADARSGALWEHLAVPDLDAAVATHEPADRLLLATPERLDQVARAFAQIIDAKSPYTYQHSEGVAVTAAALGLALGLSEAERRDLLRAALLHDIGKLGISNRILDKPARLTVQEFAAVKRHPELTYQILSRVAVFAPLAETAAAHHERLDGGGYYRGLTGERLSQPARILAVADVWDALTQDRPYRAGMSAEQALGILRAERGSRLCPLCVDALQDLVRDDGLGSGGLDSVVEIRSPSGYLVGLTTNLS